MLHCESNNVQLDDSAINIVGVVTGEGGTGKSDVIKSIYSYFTMTNASHKLRLTSPTGAAAANIFGVTIHSLLSVLSKQPNYYELYDRLIDVSIIIIDEFSFLGLDTLSIIDSRLRLTFSSNEKRKNMPFGGMHMLFVGDFMQLPPVRSFPLYSSPDTIAKSKRCKKVESLSGFHSWQSINFAICIQKNYRVTDPVHHSILQSLRRETFNDTHFELLQVL